MPSANSASPTVVTVRVLLFAAYADLLGRQSVDLEVAAPATVADVIRQLRESVPGANKLPERPLVALDHVHVHPGQPVADGAELALLPPMAGG